MNNSKLNSQFDHHEQDPKFNRPGGLKVQYKDDEFQSKTHFNQQQQNYHHHKISIKNYILNDAQRSSKKTSKFIIAMVICRNWFINQGRAHILAVLFLVIQLSYFIYSYFLLMHARELSGIRTLLGHGLMIARSAANVINLTSSILLFTVSRNTISLLRRTPLHRLIPLDEFIDMHRFVAYCLVFWSTVHTVAHYFNYMSIDKYVLWAIDSMILGFLTGPGLTGQILCIVTFLIVSAATVKVRRSNFEIFWYVHHLFIIFYGALVLHGAFCFIKADRQSTSDVCRGGPTSWKWCIFSLSWYTLDRMYGLYKSHKKRIITKVIYHPSNTLELQFDNHFSHYRPGQYISICCPEISPFQWHPFTLTSCPEETFLSVHIRVCGDWTRKLDSLVRLRMPTSLSSVSIQSSFDNKFNLPYVQIAGPYGAPSEDVFKYPVSVMIGAGIGVTPFASNLKSVWFRIHDFDAQSTSTLNGVEFTSEKRNEIRKQHKFYFIWICRDQTSFEWFRDLLYHLELDCEPGLLDIQIYLTGKIDFKLATNLMLQANEEQDTITGLNSKTNYGRPDFKHIFNSLSLNHPDTDVGVFFCGPKPLSRAIQTCCDSTMLNMKTNTIFHFQQG